MNNNFYEGLDLAYPQIAQLAESCSKFSPGSRAFYIPSLMAYKSQSSKNINAIPANSATLQNDNRSVGISKYTLGNTINIFIPQQIALYAPTDSNFMMQKGLEFLVVFAGGDMNRPVIIGGAWNG